MTTYIITANPEKELWTVFHDSSLYDKRKQSIVCNNEIIILTSQDDEIQIILLPSMAGQSESKVIEFIGEMKSRDINIITNQDNGPYLILHRNDFYQNTKDAPNLGLREGLKQGETLFPYNNKCYYYTSEGNNVMFQHFTEISPTESSYFTDLEYFFIRKNQ